MTITNATTGLNGTTAPITVPTAPVELCGLTDTLIGDADGIYHPAMFNDRLVLGLKGTMSEAELHILRARLLGGIRNKAARGELRRGLPVASSGARRTAKSAFTPMRR